MMYPNKFLLSRRAFLALTGTTIGSSFLPVLADGEDTQSSTTPPSFTLFYKPEKTGNIWDTWIYYHEKTFYLYYNPSPSHLKTLGGWNSVALATSSDGVHWKEHGTIIEASPGTSWLGAGTVWPAGEKFIMNFSEWRDNADGSSKQKIFFAESSDLIHWQRLGPEQAFVQDARWYEPNGRWDNIWAIPRPGGGYYGYWAAEPLNREAGTGFGESDDGITWRALAPAKLEEVTIGPPPQHSPEVTTAYFHQGKYYVLVGLDDLKPFTDESAAAFRPGITTMVSDSANGPFKPAPKNRRVLVTTSSYFMRFVNVGDEVLVNHHSWEIILGEAWGIYPDRIYMAPLKRAQWDDEGTLRLMWWEQNNLAKRESVAVSAGKSSSASQPTLLKTVFDPNETLILEGEIPLPDAKNAAPTGLYLQGEGDSGSAFLVRDNGAVDYGAMRLDGTGFELQGSVDRELSMKGSARFRLIRKGRLTEFYLNDYLMQCYSLRAESTGRIGVIGPAGDFGKMKAWYCA